jgi:hypothetical protein
MVVVGYQHLTIAWAGRAQHENGEVKLRRVKVEGISKRKVMKVSLMYFIVLELIVFYDKKMINYQTFPMFTKLKVSKNKKVKQLEDLIIKYYGNLVDRKCGFFL